MLGRGFCSPGRPSGSPSWRVLARRRALRLTAAPQPSVNFPVTHGPYASYLPRHNLALPTPCPTLLSSAKYRILSTTPRKAMLLPATRHLMISHQEGQTASPAGGQEPGKYGSFYDYKSGKRDWIEGTSQSNYGQLCPGGSSSPDK